MDFITPFIEWLITCPTIAQNRLFLNAVEAKDNAIQVVSEQINTNEDRNFVDGSVLHRIVFTIFDYKSISFNMLVKTMLENNENIEDLLEVSAINDWIVKQRYERNFPQFDGWEVQDIYPVYRTPSTPAIETDNLLAKYSIPIVCEVLGYDYQSTE